ncbi:MAG: TIGR02594 family protein [Rhizobiaceae bacterium]|nr:TIGR02594 family protein [Rhizobiaceae bacterium]MCV0408470.1 TIGR02594 family protein [Rhizobiaceae bacterium]
MHEIIDVPRNIAQFAERLANAGVKAAIRYYNHRNSTVFPSKCLTAAELNALHGAGISVAVVFQQRGGAGGNIGDLDAASGRRDAQRALTLARQVGQPQHSAIYFAVDWDYYKPQQLARITPYFQNVRAALAGQYLVGVYGSGTVGNHLKRQGLVDHIWLSGSIGWSGTRQALEEGNWSLFQKYMERRSEIGGFGYDGNIVNPAMANYGQFDPAGPVETPRGEGSAALYKVIARSGLNLRSGPGENYRIVESIPADSIVTGIGRDGAWMKVDVGGDGRVDGYMFATFLEPVSGGLPVELAIARKPIDVARAELALGVREISGSRHNPRIVMYHSTTRGGAAPDETAWCSSFVNYCVEQAGLRGTDSKWARSWHDSGGWGRDVTAAAVEGDIVVFRRQGTNVDGGHVGFFIEEDASSILLLGGNQGNRISIARYPKNGQMGSFRYTLLSIRRG